MMIFHRNWFYSVFFFIVLLKLSRTFQKSSCFFFGDSATVEETQRLNNFFNRFEDVLSLKSPAHVVLDDPAGNSYIQVFL